ncbi:MAG: 1-deoxy-D-xylulose-5-phosphate synthase, partial [Betaproteobacteria bacterium]|nr:1-deoxy-D-xylulose-5-phosphate synthase [Betaproteobacteria bacterium]
MKKKGLLDSIRTPADVRALPPRELPRLADELRAFILQTVSRVGGHLSSNLGVVELTVALHYVYDTPFDLLVWDVGHQTYGHKVLTGRAARLETIRRRGGLSGFPRREESEYDAFGTAHSSTSISAALGMAAAAKRRGENRRVAAVIGDGALSGGMAFEALNNAGDMKDADLLIVLNDNDMSISPPVGAINNYLGRILASRFYGKVQSGGRRMLSGMPAMQRFARRAHEHLKGMVLPGTLFEEFGFNYVGPIDGHDIPVLISALSGLRAASGPQFLHVATVKGRGFAKAEKDPVLYHGVGAFRPEDGIAPMKVEPEKKKHPAYAEIFGEWLCAAARRDEKLIAITPAMREGSGLAEFSRRFPGRYFDVGIAEQHALTFAAGLACGGMKPVAAIYSTFLQRAYDQLIHDIALQNLPVVLAVDRA